MQFSSDHARTLLDIMRWRRDVRHFDPAPLSEAVLARLKAAMELAPSVGNARPWRVLRVTDPSLRASVSAEFARCNAEAAAQYDGAAHQDYLRLKLAGLQEAPEQLAVFTDTAPDEGRGLGRSTMPETLMLSTAMAIHTLWLAARAENIGLGWVSILDPKVIADLFDVPAGWAFTAYLCLGRADFADDTPLLHRAGWQENTPTVWAEARPQHGSVSASGP